MVPGPRHPFPAAPRENRSPGTPSRRRVVAHGERHVLAPDVPLPSQADVVVGPSDHSIRSQAAVHDVVARIALHDVGLVATVQAIVPGAARDPVSPVAPVYDVVPSIP